MKVGLCWVVDGPVGETVGLSLETGLDGPFRD